MNFKDILKRIKTNDLVLPDFQRGFVWEQDRMKRLYASILAKIPVGSILSLESQDDKFNCKQIGARPRSRILKKTKKKVDYLIDGQQRFTSLLAGFSTYYFEIKDYYKGEKYDIIIGAVANDDVYRTLQVYASGLLTKEQALEALKIKRLFDQYVFASEKALNTLKFIKAEEL